MAIPRDVSLVELVRSSCTDLFESYSGIQINDASLQSFLHHMSANDFADLTACLTSSTHLTLPATKRMPLRFDSLEQELSVAVLVDLLAAAAEAYTTTTTDDGISAADILKRDTGRGVYDVVRFGVMALFISRNDSAAMSAETLAGLSLSEVSSLFDLPITREIAHPTLQCVTVSEPHPLRPFVSHLHASMVSSGGALLRAGAPRGFGELVLRVAAQQVQGDAKVDALVRMFVEMFDAFKDCGRVSEGKDVFILKNAQKLVLAIHNGFSASEPSLRLLIDATSTSQASEKTSSGTLTALIDDTIPREMIKRGIIVCSNSDGEGDSSKLVERAAAVVVCERLAASAAAAGVGVGGRAISSVDYARVFWVLARRAARNTSCVGK